MSNARLYGNAEGIHVFGAALRDGMAASKARHGKPRRFVPKYMYTDETLARHQEWKAPGQLRMRPTAVQLAEANRRAKAVREAEAWIARVRARKAATS